MRLGLMLRIVGIILICAFGHAAFAQGQEISVKLKNLKMIQQQEKGGDELYISVTEYPAQGKPIHYQVPSYPTHWLSKYITNVKDVVIWKKTDAKCEGAELLITLVEEDFVPWNMDDSLGSVALKVECVNGKAIEKWSIPDQKTAEKISNENGAFTFKGKGAQYKALFTIESKAIAK